MMKYPIGVQDFEKLIDEGYTYVDKTEFVYNIATTGHIYFMCRPRRFGKSLLISTLKAYFEGKRELFRGLAIEGLESRRRPKQLLQHDRFVTDIAGGDGMSLLNDI